MHRSVYDNKEVGASVVPFNNKMNVSLKYWKEAATLILAARASCVSVAPRSAINPNFDYEVLLLKRSATSSFMPNAYVFPGGLIDDADFSSDWVDIFKPFSSLPGFGLGVVQQDPKTRSPLFATDRIELGSLVPGEVAFRICAIRETFEESGILLALPQGRTGQKTGELPGAVQQDELISWRARILQEPKQFTEMCRELQCMPNIWALYEWSNWLTPPDLRRKGRYDTAFFVCCIQDVPSTAHDKKEIMHYKWEDPMAILSSYKSKAVWIAPPQFYELSRLCNFLQLEDLHQFAVGRGLQGCERWMPLQLSLDNSLVSVLPGDAVYPENPDWTDNGVTFPFVEKSDLHEKVCALHRLEFESLYSITVHVNIFPKYKHVNPKCILFGKSTGYNTSNH
ncbi:nucleoside diphosphate-linked moiety X motif 19 [Erpetoichthys calabaricus]|uniref:nucleoside diphosphate-linked moiety X motif 19 n=1 Tax=Erpetoichthys calabaricus TaxID=27687 RepID=UPI002234CAAF|nr:nucleoside diphosphate-linked moiety X motif 19 [Erpetoichthys calabaricus]